MSYAFTIEQKKPFFDWIKFNYSNFNDFMKLSSKNREKVFLRWKWGITDERSNQDLEISRQNLIYIMRDKKFKTQELIDYFDYMKKFEKQCREIKEKIGLISQPREIDSMTSNILKTFDATLED